MCLNERKIFVLRNFCLLLGKWTPIQGKLYHFSQERITFAKAKATCEHNFGKLFEPKTEAVNNKIAAIAREKHGIINPWIGIYYLHDEKRTVFASDNTATVAWSNWDSNEPNNGNYQEDCAHLYNKRIEDDCNYHRLGNNYCNDENNNEKCNWDGGDCCGNDRNTDFCSVCECFEPKGFEVPQCDWKQMKDGICNDETNTEECNWDVGDCCDENVDMTTCSSCECLEPARWNDNNCEDFRRFICEREDTG